MGLFETWTVPTARHVGLVCCAAAFLMIGYVFVIEAMRHGEVSVIAPFRYTIIVWALAIDLVVWGKIPTGLTLVGIAVIVLSGLYMFFRERKVSATSTGR